MNHWDVFLKDESENLNHWGVLLKDESEKTYFKELTDWLEEEYLTKKIYPGREEIFNALKYTCYSRIKAVISGQDPYPGGQGHGLAFSVKDNVKPPPSLKNIFSELKNDTGLSPETGNLIPWAQQGVLLLNNVLTVEAGKPKSHFGKGWERFTDRIISLVNEKTVGVVFLLWGKEAEKKKGLIDNPIHKVLIAPHPSPLARGGFFGCKHFSKTNEFLRSIGEEEIDWILHP